MVTIHIVCPADQNFSNVVFFTMVTMHIVCPTDKTVPSLSKEIWYFNTTIIPRLIKVWLRSFFSWPRSAPSKEIRYFNTNTFPGPRPTLFQLAHFPIVTMTIVLFSRQNYLSLVLFTTVTIHIVCLAQTFLWGIGWCKWVGLLWEILGQHSYGANSW